jgi:hypothetical protein
MTLGVAPTLAAKEWNSVCEMYGSLSLWKMLMWSALSLMRGQSQGSSTQPARNEDEASDAGLLSESEGGNSPARPAEEDVTASDADVVLEKRHPVLGSRLDGVGEQLEKGGEASSLKVIAQARDPAPRPIQHAVTVEIDDSGFARRGLGVTHGVSLGWRY